MEGAIGEVASDLVLGGNFPVSSTTYSWRVTTLPHMVEKLIINEILVQNPIFQTRGTLLCNLSF